jgi:hypothetical protein
MNPYQKFGPGTFALIERKLARREFIDGTELALALRNNSDAVLPPAIRDYLIRWLEGKVKIPRGRKRGRATQQARAHLACILYEEYLAQFQEEARQRRDTSHGKKLRSQPSPHECAAERVARELFPNHTPAYVRNLVSKHR